MVRDDQRPWETQSDTDTEKDRGHDTEKGSGSHSSYEKSPDWSRNDSDLFGDEDGGELFGDEDGGEVFGGDDSGQNP